MTERTTAGLAAVLQSLEHTREKLLQEVQGLSDVQLNSKPKREKWSIMQNLHHLHLIEQAVAASVDDALRHSEREQLYAKPVERTLDRTYKVEAPEQVRPTETILKEEQIRQMLAHSRGELLKVLQQVTDEMEVLEKSSRHPIFGKLSLQQWLEFLNHHEQRHIAQIQEAKRALHS
ncbi:DinB family protein [Ectobacillus ponti]|uniref:DinB family protein n=1 Tax=Ectobacillus ponti TaxID=2961894 RepID=A0AA41X8A1_9BACI|nr:DinB family protein [Ectobacillus ponti]MCP8968524.1 DinB family protein [Ectobacillus ponti]